MKKNNTIIALATGLCLMFGACGDYLDIVPKGMTTLNNIADLEYLLNGDYSSSAYSFDEMILLTNEIIEGNPSVIIANTNTLNYAYLTYDEEFDRYAYSSNDIIYNAYYQNIRNMNIFLSRINEVGGDEAQKIQFSAEARILRAYWHYLLVNMYAKQYDAETADSEGGIVYLRDISVETVKEKETLAEVYSLLLEDCSDEVIAALPDEAVNVLRPGKAMGYALRAKIYLQMKDYENALTNVEEALKYNGNIDDRLPVMTEREYARDEQFPSVIFYAGFSNGPAYQVISPETSARFEEGDVLKDYALVSENDSIWDISTAISIMSKFIPGTYAWTSSDYKLPAAGILSDQLYYIKGECLIRAGQYQEGLDEVNKVRAHRIDPAVYQPLKAATEQDAMQKLMDAKWIECLFTYNNFFDLRRWNTEEAYERTITRTIDGVTYSLRPDSPLWVRPFPATAVRHNPNLTQNY